MWVHCSLDSAASMAFNFFLSLIPLMVLVGFVLGHLVRTNGVDAFMAPLLDTIPVASAELIRRELQRLAGASGGSVAPLGVVTFFWLASSGVSHMMSVFEKVMHAPPRPWWKQRVLAIVYVAVGIAMASTTSLAIFEADGLLHEDAPHMPQLSVTWNGVSAPAHVVWERAPVARESHRVPNSDKKPASRRGRHPWESLAALGLALVVGVSGVALFYRYAVEHPEGIRRRAWPGALTALSAWLVVSWVFGNYVISLGKYAVYYGSLAAVAVLLVWLYLTSLALLLGAEVNAILDGVSRDEPGPDASRSAA
jgi:membrane protein